MEAIIVPAALITRKGTFLIARRKPGGECGLLWELPGGKREPGETDEETLRRELREELAVDCVVGSWYHTTVHRYRPDKIVELRVFLVGLLGAVGTLADHEEIAWITPGDAAKYRFAPADFPVIERIVRDFPAEDEGGGHGI